MFTMDACSHCDDVFAEVADVAFMDAWLPEYERNPCGTSLVIARSGLALDLLRSGQESGGLVLEDIAVDRVVLSQNAALHEKRERLALRLRVRNGRPLFPPEKRVRPAEKVLLKDVVATCLSTHVHSSCRRAWAAARPRGLLHFYARTPLFAAYVACRRVEALRNRVIGGMKRRVRQAASRMIRQGGSQ